MANVITCIRIVCATGMIFCPTFSVWFYVLYIVCGISDVLDGVAARRFGKETKLGARLDTAADIIFFAVAIIKTLSAIVIPLWLVIWIIFIAGIKCVNIIIGLIIYKRFIPEHTFMNKICGVLLFAIPLCIGLFSRQIVLTLMLFTCGIATFAAAQEGCYIRKGKEMCRDDLDLLS